MADPRPTISVVLSNYNYARYLRAAVDSALAQRYPNVEVVVVDDGSTDASREILASYGGRIRTILQENGGQPAAINAGVAASTGQLVMLLDADDWLAPAAAAAVARAWAPDVARIQFKLDVVDADGQPLGPVLPAGRIPPGHDARSMILAEGRYPATAATGVAYDRRVLDRLMPIPDADWRRGDHYLIQLAPFLGRSVWLDRILGAVRVHGANKWAEARPTPERLREYLRQDDRVEALMRAWAPELGFELPADWAFRIPNHLRARIASLRWEPERHPYPDDRRLSLAWRGMRAALRSARLAPAKRVLLAGWFGTMGVAPPALVPQLVRLAFGVRSGALLSRPHERPKAAA